MAVAALLYLLKEDANLRLSLLQSILSLAIRFLCLLLYLLKKKANLILYLLQTTSLVFTLSSRVSLFTSLHT
jgi:hypothetical protein